MMSCDAIRWCVVGIMLLQGCGSVNAGNTGADGSVGDSSGACTTGPCTLLSDDFTATSIDMALWRVNMGGGATVIQRNGMLTLSLPAAAGAFADVVSIAAFPVGTTFEGKVKFSAGQLYDHKGAGFSSARVTENCGTNETDAAMFRGQDGVFVVETALAGTNACPLREQNYLGVMHTLRVARVNDTVVFGEDGTTVTVTTAVPTTALPIRFSAYTFTAAPAQPVQIDVDSVTVTRP